MTLGLRIAFRLRLRDTSLTRSLDLSISCCRTIA